MLLKMYNECDSLTSRHEIILDGLTCYSKQSMILLIISYTFWNYKGMLKNSLLN